MVRTTVIAGVLFAAALAPPRSVSRGTRAWRSEGLFLARMSPSRDPAAVHPGDRHAQGAARRGRVELTRSPTAWCSRTPRDSDWRKPRRVLSADARRFGRSCTAKLGPRASTLPPPQGAVGVHWQTTSPCASSTSRPRRERTSGGAATATSTGSSTRTSGLMRRPRREHQRLPHRRLGAGGFSRRGRLSSTSSRMIAAAGLRAGPERPLPWPPEHDHQVAAAPARPRRGARRRSAAGCAPQPSVADVRIDDRRHDPVQDHPAMPAGHGGPSRRCRSQGLAARRAAVAVRGRRSRVAPRKARARARRRRRPRVEAAAVIPRGRP